jgi:hypothetical protein
MEELTLRQLNRLTLAKQGLLERAKGSSVAWTGRLCGIHAQIPTTPSLSLLARLEDFRRSSVDEGLRRRRLVKRWLMRGTLHIIPTGELPLYHQAMKGAWGTSLGRFLERRGLPPREVRESALYPLVLKVLGDGPLPRNEIEARVRTLLPAELRGREGFSAWGGSFKEMAYDGLIVHGPSSGGEAPLASVERWLPGVNLRAMDEAEALRGLARRYFAAYGPATGQDLASWSGIPASSLRPAVEAIKDDLLEVALVAQRGRYWTPKADAKLLARVEGADAPPRFLPRFEVLLLAYRDRSRIVDPLLFRRVMPPAAQMEATFLVDGRVAGTWGTARRGKDLTVKLQPFRPLSNASLAGLRVEAQTLAEFYGAQKATLQST